MPGVVLLLDSVPSKSPAAEVGRGNRCYSWRHLYGISACVCGRKYIPTSIEGGRCVRSPRKRGERKLCGEQNCALLLSEGGTKAVAAGVESIRYIREGRELSVMVSRPETSKVDEVARSRKSSPAVASIRFDIKYWSHFSRFSEKSQIAACSVAF